MKIRIIREAVNLDVLEEAKEDDIVAKYNVGVDDGIEPLINLFAFSKLISWLHGGGLKLSSRMTPGQMIAQGKEYASGPQGSESKRNKRIKFLPWMAKMLVGGSNIRQVIDAADLFEKFSPQLKQRNLGAYKSPDEVVDAYKKEVVAPRVAKARKKRGKSEPMMDDENRDIVYEDDNLFVVRPLTTEASCHYGRKTKWCISQDSNSYFQEYTQSGLTFYFIKDDRRKNEDRFYKVAIQVGLREGEPNIEGYWDRYDNPETSAPLPISELAGAYLGKEAQQIISKILEHANKYPPDQGTFGRLAELETEIFNSDWDNDIVGFNGQAEQYDELAHMNIEATARFRVNIDLFKDLDEDAKDKLSEFWEDNKEEEMGEELMELISYHDDYFDSYVDFDDVFEIGLNNNLNFMIGEDQIQVDISLPYQTVHDREQAEAYMNDVIRNYDEDEIENLSEKINEVINKYMAREVNPGSRERIQSIAEKIWSLNSGFKFMEAIYDKEDEEVWVSQKEPYVVPVKIPVYNKEVKGTAANAAVDKAVRVFIDRFQREFSYDFKSAVEGAMEKIDRQAREFAQKQVTMYFKLKPSLANVGKIPVGTSINVGTFGISHIRQNKADRGAPAIRLGINTVLRNTDSEKDILFAMEYVNFLDKYLPEIYEAAMKTVNVDRVQKRVNELFMNLVQGPLAFPQEVSENKRRIKIKIKR